MDIILAIMHDVEGIINLIHECIVEMESKGIICGVINLSHCPFQHRYS